MQFILNKILFSRYITSISNDEWKFLSSLDFDVLFESNDKPRNEFFEPLSIINSILDDHPSFESIKLNLVEIKYSKYPIEATVTNKGWSLIKWSVLNRFNDLCEAVDKLLESFDEKNLEKKNRILNVFSLIPVNNYGIMISLSKDPSKLFQYMDIFSKVRT